MSGYRPLPPPHPAPVANRRRPHRARRRGCLPLLLVPLAMLTGCLLGYLLAMRIPLSRAVGERVSVQLGATIIPFGGAPPLDVQQQAERILPTIIAAVPDGVLVITEAQANAYLAANQSRFAPVESLRVQFVPDTIRITVRVAGTDVQGSTGLRAEQGLPVLDNPRLAGMAGTLLAPDALLAPIQQLLHDELVQQGRRVAVARVEQGQIVLELHR
ncbi:MAG: hypothetical protein HC911_02245 [Chloroflexaceae bacterium]|nr:hypothetical protein [Chloroflexaceae bacterium]